MSKALDELRARLAEIETDLAFVSLAARLRPRLGDIVNWNGSRDVVDLAREFMNSKTFRAEGLFGVLLVRLFAALERYTRGLVEHVITVYVGRATSYDHLQSHLKTRNVVLTGTLLRYSEAPREHLTIHVETLIRNLASCHSGSSEYRLNPEAFTAAVTGAAPPAIEKALANVGIHEWWDRVGADTALAEVLGTRGSRATGKQAQSRLEELSRWRNHLAHAGDEEVALTEESLRDCLAFVRAFSAALDDVALSSARSGEA